MASSVFMNYSLNVDTSLLIAAWLREENISEDAKYRDEFPKY